jgi:anti-sigma factor RsiW
MDCTGIRPLISYYYDGEATPEERAQVEQHLAGCEDCRRILAQYRTIGSEIRDLAVPAPPAGLHRDVWRAIEAQQTSTPRWKQQVPPAPSKSPSTVVDISTARKQKRPAFATVLGNVGGSWARALPAALLIGALGIMLAVFIFVTNRKPSETAKLVDPSPVSVYTQGVQVIFGKRVLGSDAEKYTTVS